VIVLLRSKTDLVFIIISWFWSAAIHWTTAFF